MLFRFRVLNCFKAIYSVVNFLLVSSVSQFALRVSNQSEIVM